MGLPPILTKKGVNYDEERNYEVYCADHRIDRIGDPDCTRSDLVYGLLIESNPSGFIDQGDTQL